MKTVPVSTPHKIRLVGWLIILAIMTYILVNVLSGYLK